jgi:hypothetical protein
MIITARGIGLPGFDQHVLRDVARAVEDAPFDNDALSLDVRSCDLPGEIAREDFETGLRRNESDVHVWAGRLRRRLG